MPEGSMLDHMSKNKNWVCFAAGYLTPTQPDTEKLSAAFTAILEVSKSSTELETKWHLFKEKLIFERNIVYTLAQRQQSMIWGTLTQPNIKI